MPILSAAIVPNLALLVPSIGQEQLLAYEQTIQAYYHLASQLAEHQVETVVIISNRGTRPSTGLGINVHPEFNINFEAFGDLATKLHTANNFSLVDKLRLDLGQNFPLSMISLAELDYGSAVPLFYFLNKLPKLRVVILYPATDTGLYSQSELGAKISQIIHSHPSRSALIASSCFSSRLTSSPLGALGPARGHDKKIIKGFETNDHRFLYNFPADEINTYYEKGLATLAMFAGAIDRFHKQVTTLSYEHPQGVGAAVINVDFHKL